MIFLVGFSFVLLLAGSYLLAFHTYVWDSGLLLILGVGGVLLTLRRLGYWRAPTLSVSASPQEERPWGWVRAASLALSMGVAFTARIQPDTVSFAPLVWLWLLALVGFMATLLIPRFKTAPVRFSLSRYEALGLMVLLFVALLSRGVALGRVPANMGGDEGTQALISWQLVQPPLGNPFATGWYAVPTLSFYVYGLTMQLFGATLAGARALSALCGALTILAMFMLGRELGGRRVGWFAAVVMAFSAYSIHFSRLASNQVFDPLIGALAVALVWRALHAAPPRAQWAWGLAGIVAGLGWYAYFGARWATFLLAICLGERWLREPRFLARHGRGLALLALGWLVTALPLLGWYTAHPSDLTARYNAVSIFASGWLTREVGITGKSVVHLLFEQFWKAVTAFHLTPDPTFWYFPQAPLLDFISGALLIVGMTATFTQWRRPSRSWVLLWFWSTLIMAWVVTENPPSSQRGLLLMPAVALLIAWGLDMLWVVLARYRYAAPTVTLSLLAAAALLNGLFYFGVYTPRRVYGNPTAAISTEVSRFVVESPVPGSTCYFFGAPYLYWDFGTLAFLLRDQPGFDVPPDALPDAVAAPARFIFVPERQAELGAVRARYPGGSTVELRDARGALLALIYDWQGAGAP